MVDIKFVMTTFTFIKCHVYKNYNCLDFKTYTKYSPINAK